MVEKEGYAWAPIGAPLDNVQRQEPLRHFDNSVNAVSFGFVATAILISMFLIMAIFERFLRPTSQALSPSGGRNHRDLESQMGFNAKLGHPSPKVSNSCHFSFYFLRKVLIFGSFLLCIFVCNCLALLFPCLIF